MRFGFLAQPPLLRPRLLLDWGGSFRVRNYGQELDGSICLVVTVNSHELTTFRAGGATTFAGGWHD